MVFGKALCRGFLEVVRFDSRHGVASVDETLGLSIFRGTPSIPDRAQKNSKIFAMLVTRKRLMSNLPKIALKFGKNGDSAAPTDARSPPATKLIIAVSSYL